MVRRSGKSLASSAKNKHGAVPSEIALTGEIEYSTCTGGLMSILVAWSLGWSSAAAAEQQEKAANITKLLLGEILGREDFSWLTEEGVCVEVRGGCLAVEILLCVDPRLRHCLAGAPGQMPIFEALKLCMERIMMRSRGRQATFAVAKHLLSVLIDMVSLHVELNLYRGSTETNMLALPTLRLTTARPRWFSAARKRAIAEAASAADGLQKTSQLQAEARVLAEVEGKEAPMSARGVRRWSKDLLFQYWLKGREVWKSGGHMGSAGAFRMNVICALSVETPR